MNSKFEYRFIFLQLLVLIFILSIWEWGWEFNQWLVEDYPRSVQKLFLITILDPFFISQPSEIWIRFQEMSCFITKSGQSTFFHQNEFWQCIDKNRYHLWGMTWATLYNTFWGFLVGVSSGVLVGLILGRSYVLAKIFEPFIVAFNSLPRIALVPLIVLLFGLGDLSKIMTAWIIIYDGNSRYDGFFVCSNDSRSFVGLFRQTHPVSSAPMAITAFCRTLDQK